MCGFEGLGFDITATAGWYSAIAGLLAGFALLSVLLPLDHETRDRGEGAERAAASGVIVFTSAFFSLVIVAFIYAVLAGRSTVGAMGGVVAHEQQINGAAFGFASLLVMLGLREVLRLYGGNRRILLPAEHLITRVTAIYAPIILVGFQFRNAGDVETFRAVRDPASVVCVGGVSSGVWINIVLSAVAIILILLGPTLTRRKPKTPKAAALAGRWTLGFTIAVALWTSAVLPFLPLDVTSGAPLEHLTLALTAAGSVAFGAAVWASR